jgi:hypothetical protein
MKFQRGTHTYNLALSTADFLDITDIMIRETAAILATTTDPRLMAICLGELETLERLQRAAVNDECIDLSVTHIDTSINKRKGEYQVYQELCKKVL